MSCEFQRQPASACVLCRKGVPAASLVGILIPLAHRTLSPQLQSSHRPSAFLLVTLRMSSQGKVNENEKL